MDHLERLQTRCYLGIQHMIVSQYLEDEPDLSPERRRNWEQLRDTLAAIELLMHDMESDQERRGRELHGLKIRVLEDAERIGEIKAHLKQAQEELQRIKPVLSKALRLLDSNNINHNLWHN